jgi:bifunctional DNA-binding transcriptional regulator/antitoxin component of YhaV-PrlF toxin-antitoxin module
MATLTYRSLIKFGTGIALTIPKAWADFYKLKPGDKVIVIANRRLMVKPVDGEAGQLKRF